MKARAGTALLVAGLAVIVALVWWTWVHQVDLVYAMKGFSPIAWVYKTLRPADFVSDFPSGIENHGHSAFLYVYLLGSFLGLSPENLMPAVIAFELVLFSWAVWMLSRELVPSAPTIVAALVVVLAIATPLRGMNLAYFPAPNFVGQYYNVADALRIFGIVMVLRGRPLSAAALLAGSFATHALMGAVGVACALAMLLTRPREARTPRHLAAAALFGLLAGGWLLLQFRSATVSGGEIPAGDWVAMTRAFSYHWYSVDNGLFAARGHLVLLPFVSFLLLLAYYRPGRDSQDHTTRRVFAGLTVLLVLSVAGLAIAALTPVPVLVKLALHRSNDLLILIGLVYVVAGLWRDVRDPGRWRGAVAAATLLSLFWGKSFPWRSVLPELPLHWAPALSVGLVAPAWLRVLRRQSASRADWIVTLLSVAVAALGLLYVRHGLTVDSHPGTLYSFYGGRRTLLPLLAFLGVAFVLVRWGGARLLPAWAVAVSVPVALIPRVEWAERKLDTAFASDYMRAQVWARENTPGDALFMTDPTIYYGWRDFSRRSSFGNVREWLHTSWMYNSSVDSYREGLRRFGEFGVELRPCLDLEPPIDATGRLTEAVRKRYYDASDEWRLSLARRYGIDYFVLRRGSQVRPSRLSVAYENENFVVYAAQQ